MPEKATLKRAQRDRHAGKSKSTQAGEFVKQEMDHIRQGKHGARNTKQAIAIGLSEARRAGVDVPAGKASKSTRRKAAQDKAAARHPHKTSATRSRATKNALKKEPRRAASKTALSRHSRDAASKRSASSRSAAAKKAARTRARRASRK